MIGVPGQSAPTITGYSLDIKAHIHRHLVETARDLSAELAEGIAVAGPLALPKPDARGLSVFLARAVIGQQLSVKAARRIWGRVEGAAHRHGDHLLAFLTEEHAPILKTCGVSGPKVQTLLALNAAEARGDLCPTRLRALTHEARTAHLCRIRGIGPWTGDMAAIFYFQEPESGRIGMPPPAKSSADCSARGSPWRKPPLGSPPTARFWRCICGGGWMGRSKAAPKWARRMWVK